jgi:hypothetical protein
MGTIIVLYKMEFRWKIDGGEFKKESGPRRKTGKWRGPQKEKD